MGKKSRPELEPPLAAVREDVRRALREDIGAGDVSARLLPESVRANAAVTAREACVLCGRDWFNEVFRALDERIVVRWRVEEGAPATAAAGPITAWAFTTRSCSRKTTSPPPEVFGRPFERLHSPKPASRSLWKCGIWMSSPKRWMPGAAG